jgi:beta-galactosidase
MLGFFTAFRALGVDVDLVYLPVDTGGAAPAPNPPYNFSQYTVLVAPSLLIVPPALASALVSFVAGGGSLFLSMRSGAKDGASVYTDMPLPGPLAGIAGITMDTWDPQCSLGEESVVGEALWPEQGSNHSVPIFPSSSGVLCEVLIPAALPSVTVLGVYGGGIHGGKPAITVNRDFAGGGGACIYSGTSSASPQYYAALAKALVPAAGLPNLLPTRLPYGVEVSTRVAAGGGAGSTVFVLNWNGQSQVVTIPYLTPCVDVLHDVPIPVDPAGVFTVPGYDVAIFSCP